jgi:uncharacterized OB-fold protein
MLQAPIAVYELQVSELTQTFWDAAKEGRLVFQRCTACAKPFFRPEVACPHCLSTDWTWEDSAGRATLSSFSVMHRAPTPAFTAPFVFAAVEVDEGYTMFTNLVGMEAEDARIGMPLKAVFHTLENGQALPYFAPV